MIVSPLPNSKTDINNSGAISTDFIGGSWNYPDSNWTVKEQVFQAHVEYPYCISVVSINISFYQN